MPAARGFTAHRYRLGEENFWRYRLRVRGTLAALPACLLARYRLVRRQTAISSGRTQLLVLELSHRRALLRASPRGTATTRRMAAAGARIEDPSRQVAGCR